MNKAAITNNNHIGYEYTAITVRREVESMYADSYQNFGWIMDGKSNAGINSITLKFKRDKKIMNKMELTRLQRQFDACVNEITVMGKSKTSDASKAAYTVALIGIVLTGISAVSFLKSLIPIGIISAIFAFAGLIFPYFLYKSTYAKKTAKVNPLIEIKYNEIYEVCERAKSLLVY
jgi:hypothetical protein